MRDDMTLGARRDSGSPLEGRWRDVLADGSWKVGEIEGIMLWFKAFRDQAGVVVTSRAAEAKRQGVMRRNVAPGEVVRQDEREEEELCSV